jgi:quinol monooxygenase YgiN
MTLAPASAHSSQPNDQEAAMSILEIVRITSKPGRGDELGPRLERGLASQAADPNCLGVTVRRSVERPDEFLLELTWTSVEAHAEWQQLGRQAWKNGVGFDIVDGGPMGLKHYETVATIKGPEYA